MLQRFTSKENSGDRRTFSQNVKPKKKYILIRLWKYLARYRFLLILAVIIAVSSNVLALWGPALSGKAINAMFEGNTDFSEVWKNVFLMLVCYLVSGVMSYSLAALMTVISKKVVYRMRKDVFESLVKLPVSFFDKYQAGEIISIISYDIDTVNQTLTSDLVQIMKSFVTVFGALFMMLSIAPKLVLVFAVTIPLSVVFTKFITKKVRPLFRKRSAKLGELNGYVEEMISGHKTTKAYGSEDKITELFDTKNEAAVESYTKSEYYGTIVGPGVNFINNLSLALVSVFGSIMLLNGNIDLGGISSFVQYSRKFSGPINETANIIGELQSSFAAAERVFRLIDTESEKPDSDDAIVLEKAIGNVNIDHAVFGYTPDKVVLHDLSLEAKAGSLTAIVGKTGAGKTTIVNLLMRFYDVNSGNIFVDNNSIYKITRDSLRKNYTMVLQDTWLFHGTVFENLAYGRESITKEEVIDACKVAKIHSFITALPNGYDTVLTDGGLNISKGQKQLLTIVRAMLSDSEILILDEATSNVDTGTEKDIQNAMRTLMKGKTCFVIAHRLSTIQNANNIIVVKKGDVVEQGTHRELLEKQGEYYSLYNSQFEGD